MSTTHTHHTGQAPLPPGFYPFWFWNDDLRDEEIRRQIGEMAAQGVKGFFIHPRQGLRQPYLAETFLDRVAVAIDEAAARGLIVHLYDEYPYPSGIAGGEVTLGRPQFHATRLVQRAYDLPGGHVRLALPRGKVLACAACPLRDGRADWSAPLDLRDSVGVVLAEGAYFEQGLTMYNRKRYFASRPTPVLDASLPAGPHRLFVSVQVVEEHHKYWDHFADVMNPAAVREFLWLTHERYRRRFGERFGSLVWSIFVDETEPRWTDRLPEVFRQRCGYDLPPLLPALQDERHPQHVQVLRDLRRVQYEMFCESWEQPYLDWCRANRIRYSGEKPSWRLAQLKYMDIPGCEPGHTKAGARMDLLRAGVRSNARATASAAYFYGKEGSLCECYHSMGWSATLQDARLIADGLLLMGIDYLVPHGFFYSTHALRKHDAPPTFFFQAPYWPLFGRLSARVERIAKAMEGTHIAAEVLVIDPSAGLPAQPDRQAYERLRERLMREHLDFLMVDTDILEAGRIEAGRVHIRDVAARVVIVPPMRVLEPPLAEWLQRFEAAGGCVVRCDAAFEDDEPVRALRDLVHPHLRICGRPHADDVQVVTRRNGRRTCWLVVNTGRERIDATFAADTPLREIPLEPDVPPLLRQEGDHFARTLLPFEAVLFEAVPQAEPADTLPRVHVRVAGPATVRPQGANVMRLYDWQLALLGSDGRIEQEATVPAVPLIHQLQRGRFRFAPAVQEYWGTIHELRLPVLQLRYEVEFESTYTGRVELVMEPDSIVGDWWIQVNEAAPFGPAAFSPSDAHVRGSLGVDITPHLRPGRNAIRVDVRTDRVDGGLLNALYLAGDFGVRLEPPALLPRRQEGAFEAYEANGLPFYAGVVEYEMQVDLPAPPQAPADSPVLVEFDFGPAFEDACEVAFNDDAWHALPWSPRLVQVPAGTLRGGPNRLRIRVYTSLGCAFEGQVFDPVRHEYRDVGSPST